jgi:Flp pilus assembly pilin Flp
MATKPGVKPKFRTTGGLIPCREETVMELIIKFPWDEAGGSMVEYGLLVAVLTVGIAASVNYFGSALTSLFSITIPWSD